MITTATEARAYILKTIEFAGREVVMDAIVRWSNSIDNEINKDGDVWVCDPQTGHWLDDERLIEFTNFLAGW